MVVALAAVFTYMVGMDVRTGKVTSVPLQQSATFGNPMAIDPLSGTAYFTVMLGP